MPIPNRDCFCSNPRVNGSKLLLLFFGLHCWNASEAKTIRLRNEVIDPDSSSNLVKKAASAPVSNLYLVQFKGSVGAAERAELKAAGVELLKYVPDDTFIAKFNNVSLATIAAKNFIAWVGPYRPEHKIHPRLASAISEATNATQTVSVNILVSPSASSQEIVGARSLLRFPENSLKAKPGY